MNQEIKSMSIEIDNLRNQLYKYHNILDKTINWLDGEVTESQEVIDEYMKDERPKCTDGTDDMIELINCFSDDIDVYIGSAGNHQISSEVSFACPNGHMIQINTKSCDEFENLKDWKFLTDGLKNEGLN